MRPMRCSTLRGPLSPHRALRQGASTAQWRAFSATRIRKDSVLDIVTAIPRGYMDLLHHHLSLPWWAVIPLTAITMRATLSYFPTKKIWENNNLLVALHPLIAVSTYAASRAEGKHAKAPRWTAAAIQEQQQRAMNVRRDIGKEFGVNDTLKQTMINFSVFVVGAEAVRSKLGLEQGLLGLLWRGVRWPFERVSKDVGHKTLDTVTIGPVPLEQELEILNELEPTIPAGFDPTTLVEGPSWCTDLTLADPTGLLPVLTAFTVFLNVLLRPQRASATTYEEWCQAVTVVEILQLLFVPVFWIIGARLPAGLLLYTMWSILSTKMLNIYFGIRNPRPRQISPCTSFAPRINRRAT